MGEKRDRSGKQVRPKTAMRGKRYLCAVVEAQPDGGHDPGPVVCPNCLQADESPVDRREDAT